jgi:hypothetical protein
VNYNNRVAVNAVIRTSTYRAMRPLGLPGAFIALCVTQLPGLLWRGSAPKAASPNLAAALREQELLRKLQGLPRGDAEAVLARLDPDQAQAVREALRSPTGNIVELRRATQPIASSDDVSPKALAWLLLGLGVAAWLIWRAFS